MIMTSNNACLQKGSYMVWGGEGQEAVLRLDPKGKYVSFDVGPIRD